MGIYTELSLFSGMGAFSLGLRLSGIPIKTVCYVERDDYCQRILRQRMADKVLDDARIWDDIKTFDGLAYRDEIDIISASPPCQPFSKAGSRRHDDDRNLVPECVRVVGEVLPRLAILENVPGIASRRRDGRPAYAGDVFGLMAEIGYDTRWICLSAKDAGAPHRRDRWWCLAYPNADTRRRLFGEDAVDATEARIHAQR